MMTEDLIDKIMNQDFAKAGPMFTELLQDKLSIALDAEKARLADQIYNGITPEEESEEDDIEMSDEDMEADLVDEAAKQGATRYSDETGMVHKVLHNDGKGNHLTMTYGEEPGGVTYHGKMHGHKIRIDAEGKHGDDPNKSDVTHFVKKAKLPPETHKEVLKHAHAGLKHLGGGDYD